MLTMKIIKNIGLYIKNLCYLTWLSCFSPHCECDPIYWLLKSFSSSLSGWDNLVSSTHIFVVHRLFFTVHRSPSQIYGLHMCFNTRSYSCLIFVYFGGLLGPQRNVFLPYVSTHSRINVLSFLMFPLTLGEGGSHWTKNEKCHSGVG